MREPEGDIDDETLLEAVFDRAVDLLSEGSQIDVEGLLEGRERLRERAGELVQLAREVVVRAAGPHPHVPGYEIERELGRGGMGAVYLARQTRVGGRRVALKVLPALAVASARSRERFVTEIRSLSKLDHPNIVAIHDVVQERDICAYAMDWVDGGSLADVIRRGAPRAGERITFLCGVALSIARAMAAAHAAGIVHRDVKPSNILITRDGTPRLSDFGLARDDESSSTTKSDAFVGTPAYSSPEQLRGGSRAIDARSDVYSLGATLYHALSDKLPYQGHSTTEILFEIEHGRLAPLRKLDPKLPRDLETIVATAMESNPARRYASADEFADDLARLLEFQPIRARPAGVLARTAKLVRRNRGTAFGLITGSVASLALAAAAVAYLFFVPRWVEEDVREARLALLDPSYATAIFNSELFGVEMRRDSPLLSPAGFAEALGSYDAALRWAPRDATIREERDVVAQAAGHSSVTSAPRNERSAGLSAYLRGDVDVSLDHWSAWERQRDPRATADPLVETLTGVLHLVRDEPARAYPRLREACRVFPNVGFLTTYLADAAVRCGEFDSAGRLLEIARDMPRPDPNGALERVTADLYAATGRDREAEKLFAVAPNASPMLLHYARFLESRGRIEEATDLYVALASDLHSARVQRECAQAIERWWAGRSGSERWAHIRATLDLAPVDPRSLVLRCRICMNARASETADVDRRSSPGGQIDARVNRRAPISSPSIESVGLTELAQILEVENMTRWNDITHYPQSLDLLQRLAWRSPWPRLSSKLVHGIFAVGSGRARRAQTLAAVALAFTAAANADCRTYYASLGTLPTSQGWVIDDSLESPAPYVSGGWMHQGPTLSACGPGGYQSWYVSDLPYDFGDSVTFEARLKIISSNDVFCGGSWRAGYYLQLNDSNEHSFFLGISSNSIYLANDNIQDPAVFPRHSVDTTQAFHTYRLTVTQNVATIYYDGVALDSLPTGTSVNPGSANQSDFGDVSHAGSNESLLDYVRFYAWPDITTYCTAGTTTNGCNATMSASGTPSISATSGFALDCTNVEGQKFGLLFYGVNGSAALSWGPASTSFLCVKSPTQRTPAVNSGGTEHACDGSFSRDFLAYLAGTPGALGQPFTAGQCVYAQAWFRDPPAPRTTNLSNGLQFTTCP